MNISTATEYLRQRLSGVIAIYLFGSQASGEATPTSDVDMAVLVAGTVEPLQLWTLSGELADLLGSPVDLLDLRAASTVMQYQVITTGRLLWSKGVETGLFETFILSEKTALNEARAGLINDIYRDGRVHGG